MGSVCPVINMGYILNLEDILNSLKDFVKLYGCSQEEKLGLPILLCNDVLRLMMVEAQSWIVVRAKGCFQTLPGVLGARALIGVRNLVAAKGWLSSSDVGAKAV